ncbi:MAG: hypothetical protein JW808_05115 [Victivallales bacterium]|nr:hypothetical protein [Victivallales bacterium]
MTTNNYGHQRSQEELLTEMFAGLLRKSESFRCSFIQNIYSKIKDRVRTDFTDYTFRVHSENHDHDIDGVLRFDVKLEGKNKAGDTFLLCIENKVGDIIHLKQMQRYARFLEDYRSTPGMDASIVMITKSGTFYDDMEKLSPLIDGHFYWDDVLKLIEKYPFDSEEFPALKEKNEVVRKITELGCEFFEWPSCINEFKFSSLVSFNNDTQEFRRNLQQITHPIFRDQAIFQKLGIDYDHARLNSPANTISYCYIFHPSKGKSFRTGKWGLLSLTLWISFGYKVTSHNPLAVGFKRPTISISLNLPPAEQYFKDSPELTKKYDEFSAVLKRLAPAELIPMIEFETDGMTDACDLFLGVKTEFISRLGIWKEAGVFGHIDKFFAEINA